MGPSEPVAILWDAPTADRRQVVGTTCAEVAEALGLIAALALDPNGARSLEVERHPPQQASASPIHRRR